jgi:D-lactate dehydrogenase (cytochrome)
MPQVKNSAGYFVKEDMDLLDLFIGAEGTLGFFSEIEVRLVPAPAAVTGMMVFFPSEEGALGLAAELKRAGPRPVAMEFFDARSVEFMREIRGALAGYQMGHEVPAGELAALYLEYHGADPGRVASAVGATVAKAARHGADERLSWIESGHEAIRNFKQIKHLFPEMLNGRVAKRQEEDPRIRKLGTDLAVPEAEFGNIMALYREGLDEGGFDHMIFGHLGDSNLHVNIIARDFEEYERGRSLYLRWARAAVRMGGTVSAEHGIGKTKKEMLKELYGEQEIDEMRQLKRLFDPDCLLNRGNMFDCGP